MRKIQSQGIHHITIIGADRQTSIDFWEGVLGMPFVFDQPNLDNPDEGHVYFDPGDGRLITVFTDETRKAENGAHRKAPGICIIWPLPLARRHLPRPLNVWTNAASPILAQKTAALWIQYISGIHLAC